MSYRGSKKSEWVGPSLVILVVCVPVGLLVFAANGAKYALWGLLVYVCFLIWLLRFAVRLSKARQREWKGGKAP